MTTLEHRARQFAALAHAGQQRKYTGEPYINHPAEVVELVRSVPHTEAMLAAAWLHDVVEDCGIHIGKIARMFGFRVAQIVDDLSDVSLLQDGNRKIRKALDLEHTAQASPSAKTIKLADLISNSRSIGKHDPKFARIYLEEKAKLLEVLTEGDKTLFSKAKLLLDALNN